MHPAVQPADEKMRAAAVSGTARATFARLLERLLAGESGAIHGDELEPVHDLPALEDLPPHDASDALARAVVIKLNGGLGTSMG